MPYNNPPIIEKKSQKKEISYFPICKTALILIARFLINFWKSYENIPTYHLPQYYNYTRGHLTLHFTQIYA